MARPRASSAAPVRPRASAPSRPPARAAAPPVAAPAVSRPTPAQVAAAYGTTIQDVLAPGLRVVFCGINPSLYSAAVGHHFARPGNRFWPALHAGGFTERQLSPFEDRTLLARGYGLTNLVDRATASADELTPDELLAGGKKLRRKLRRYAPEVLAVLGIGAFRHAFGRPDAVVGEQPEQVSGVRVWVLPNPSGLNAHYTLPALSAVFAELRAAVTR